MSDVALHRLGGEGPDLLFIHGFGADRLSWLAVAPLLFDLATVWAVEYAGHGATRDDLGAGDPLTFVHNALGHLLLRPANKMVVLQAVVELAHLLQSL